MTDTAHLTAAHAGRYRIEGDRDGAFRALDEGSGRLDPIMRWVDVFTRSPLGVGLLSNESTPGRRTVCSC